MKGIVDDSGRGNSVKLIAVGYSKKPMSKNTANPMSTGSFNRYDVLFKFDQ
jgi:hypothetical protein